MNNMSWIWHEQKGVGKIMYEYRGYWVAWDGLGFRSIPLRHEFSIVICIWSRSVSLAHVKIVCIVTQCTDDWVAVETEDAIT